jgi:hypothetical protein
MARCVSVKSSSVGAVNVSGAESAWWNTIQPSPPPIGPAPDQITSPLASSSSSIAGW